MVNGDGNYISTVGSEGSVFIGNGQFDSQLFVRSESGAMCRLDFALPAKAPENALYEEHDAVCRPGALPSVAGAPNQTEAKEG